ncbi:T-complex protein 11-domain-containing protein [Xylogone sp. PMI_703]|nr:T-complex protein 11-domain-containing protein [Xylogone sp. PMI_703]
MRRASDDLSDPDRNLAESTGSAAGIPEDQDTDIILEDDSRIYTPPPHIVARFYRPSFNRRKSSAASSRRNSISSVHSHQSHTSGHIGGPQSSYIAQHLRRASIIESRKARLADRAAHVEKVRLRAALAKAQSRSTNNSEERALAAQQAREKNLAEIVASCAEEVKRAKAVAESMKEKREAEGKRLRQEMEEKLAEAERRREEFLHRSAGTKRARSTSSPRKSPSPTPRQRPPIDEATAATRIQERWRISRRAKALKEFSNLGLTVDHVRETSFQDVVDLLAQERVLMATARILRICGLKEGESGSVNEMTAVRTFLSAFLILGHPTQVLSSKGENSEQEQVGSLPMLPHDDLANPQLQDLVAKATELLITFEHVLSRLTAANNYTAPPAQLTTLSESYAAFYNAFIAWKARDSSALIDVMVMQFVELDAIWQTVKNSTEDAVMESYRDGIRENQLKLMVRIKRLAGPVRGKQLITNAIREARKSRAAKKPTGDSRPRAAEPDATTAPASISTTSRPAADDVSAATTAISSSLGHLTPPPTPPRGARKSSADALRVANTVLPDNRKIVHELALNKDYRIEKEDIINERGTIFQLIFESMREEIQRGQSDAWVLAMAENIRGKLQSLLRAGNSMHTLIGEALDTNIVARELAAGTFSYEKFFSFMGSILPRLCAPARDEEVKDLIENKLQHGDVVDRLQALMGFIDTMHLDYANFCLQQTAPELIKHGITYEMKVFAEWLEQHGNNLEATTKAWKEAKDKVMAEAARRDPENIQLPRSIPGPDKIYAQMLVDVFLSTKIADVDTDTIPETLQLDIPRIKRTRADILRIVTAGAIILQCKNLLKRDVRSQWKTEASRIISVLETAKTIEQRAQGVQAALECGRSMPVATKNHIRDLVNRIVAASTTAENESGEVREPVMRLLLVRLRGHVLARLAASTTKEKVKATSTASESLASLGLPEFVGKVGSIVEELGKVGALDRAAHGAWYEQIAGGDEQQ